MPFQISVWDRADAVLCPAEGNGSSIKVSNDAAIWALLERRLLSLDGYLTLPHVRLGGPFCKQGTVRKMRVAECFRD